MSDSDSQNVSGRDYDVAGNESFTPSTGGSTLNQIDEVEHVSADTEENEGPLRTSFSTEDVSTSDRGKSPRVVASALFPRKMSPASHHLSPRTVEDVASSLRRGGAPRELHHLRQISGPKNYDPKPVAARVAKVSSAEPSQDMVLDKAFIAATATPRPKTKVALGAKKAAVAKPPVDPPVTNVSAPTPIDTSSGGATAPDLHVMHSQSRRGKEKRQEPEVEEVLTLKRTKRSSSSRPLELQEGLHERDSLAATPVDQIRDKPHSDRISDFSSFQLTHTTTELFCRARALEGIRDKEVEPLKKQISSAEVRIRELEEEFGAAENRSTEAKKDLADVEGRAEKAEKAEQEAIEKMKDANSVARFICSDKAIAKEFLTAFINTEVGDKLVWIYGQWAFTSGCRAMQEQVHTTLTEGLKDTDLPEVLALLPGEVADPGPKPYSESGPLK
nr:leucine zipper putative tumor suppressor 2-like [Ipomoea batatas]